MVSLSRNLKFSVVFLTSTLLALFFFCKAAAAQPAVATVQDLTVGDRACYVKLTDSNGQVSTEFANFEICDQDIVGKQVRLTYESGNIMAESCQGDPECAQSETVMLITGAEVLAVSTPTPTTTIQSLPDGNYRYWSGPANESIVSVESPGNTAFRFRKQGNNITGTFTYVEEDGPGMSVICVQGQVNGNTVSGTATSTPQRASALSTGESFENIDPNGTLAVRRGRLNGFQVRYSSALLNLAKLNRINAGTIVPPKQC